MNGLARKTCLLATLIGALLTVTTTAQAQGLVLLQNYSLPVMRCPVYGPEPIPFYAIIGNSPSGIPAGTQVYTDAPIVGTGYTAELWAASLAAGPSALQPVPGGRTTFRTGPTNSAAAGLTVANAIPLAVPGVLPGEQAWFRLRVWDNQCGRITNWAKVFSYCDILRGESPAFLSYPLGGDAGTPLFGLQSFNLFNCLAVTFGPRFVIESSPPAQNVEQGETLALNLISLNYPECPVWIQWKHDDLVIPGATNNSLVLTNVVPADSGRYAAVITGLVSTNTYSTSVVVHPPAVFLQSQLGPDGVFSATLQATPARRYSLQVSSNLVEWAHLRLLLESGGTIPISEPTQGLGPARFFRTRLLP